MNSVSVFCASSPGHNKFYFDSAFAVGKKLAEEKIAVVYGGAKVGLMGAVADGALSVGGKVIGVLPKFMSKKEIAHTGLTELVLVESMHERKLKMHELSSGAIALPGGFGTMEELFEILTWLQLGLHKNPVGVLNQNGFYDPLLDQVKKMNFEGFLSENNMKMLLFSDNLNDLLKNMKNFKDPGTPKWLTEEQV
ncbi:MAG: TIGR00730 family Rossman fold protein [Bacteroidia bacterium]|nr:TIGR00730 family Rossman fold protein [Bacteroidia bacterium]